MSDEKGSALVVLDVPLMVKCCISEQVWGVRGCQMGLWSKAAHLLAVDDVKLLLPTCSSRSALYSKISL